MKFESLRPARLPAAAAAVALAASLTLGSVGCQADEMGPSANDATPLSKQQVMGEMDADMRAVIEQLQALGGKPIETLSAQEARQQPTPADAVMALMAKKHMTPPTPKLASTKNQTIPGPAGEIPIRVFTPQGAGPFPALVYYHGGGWVIAGVDAYQASMQALAEKVGAVVIAPSYRQAPENPYPAAAEDAYATLLYVFTHADELNVAPGQVAVGGESAGGNLATVVCLMAQQQGGELPVHQLLVYPVADNDTTTESYVEQKNAIPLNAAMMPWFFEKYLGSDWQQEKAITALPMKATGAQLAQLPPATVVNAEIDPLRSEGEAYAAKLEKAGVDVEQKTFTGVTHEFFGMAAVVDKAKQAQAFAVDRLKASFKQ